MKVALHTDQKIFDELEQEWNQLLSHSTNDLIFLTWEWQSTWWRVYHPGELWLWTFREEDDQLIGIVPLFIEQDEDGNRSVRCIGSEDVTDYLDIIVHRDHIAQVYDCLSEKFGQFQDQYDLISLTNITENSPTYTLFPTILESKGFEVNITHPDVCPIIELPETWDEYLAALNKKQRHEIRRKMRRMEGLDKEVDWYVVDDSRDINQELETFLRLMAASDPEKTGFLEDDQNREFFTEFTHIAHENDWLQLIFLTIGGEPVAAYLNFEYQDEVQVYNSGLDHEEYSFASPGIVLLAYNIQYAIDKKFKKFNFLRGDETYKHRMGGKDTQLYQLNAKLG